MKTIIKNGKKYLRFKIGDEFEYIRGKGSFNKMVEEGLAQKEYDEDKGFIYPFYTAAIKNNFITGYCKSYNFSGSGIKVISKGQGGAGKTKYITEKCWVGERNYVLINENLANEYTGFIIGGFARKMMRGTASPSITFSELEHITLEIPENHEELAKQVKVLQKYKLDIERKSKGVSEHIKQTKKAILWNSEMNIKRWKENGDKDKFLRFKIGDGFNVVSSAEKLTILIKEGKAKKEKDESTGHVYPVYNDSTAERSIQGYCQEYTTQNSLRVTMRGVHAGDVLCVREKYYNSTINSLESDVFANEHLALYLSKFLSHYAAGSIIKALPWKRYKNEYIEIPSNHAELAVKIKKLNELEELVLKTLKDIDKANDKIFLSTF